MRSGDEVLVALDRVCRNGELITAVQPHRPIGESAEPDLGSLQISEYPHGSAGCLRSLPHLSEGGLVVRPVAVTEIQSSDVQPRFNEGSDRARRAGRRTEGGNDLGSAHPSSVSRHPTCSVAWGRVLTSNRCSTSVFR